tara:strand:+ start:5162 stop:5914 length:753 start_codon:yes stop_codon:yes gene_type:complete
MDGHPNPPTISFTKRVGQTEEKNAVRDFALQCLNIMATDVDFTGHRLNIVLTRAQTGNTSGSLRTSLKPTMGGDYITDLSSVDLMVNIDFNGRDSYQNTIAHEMVHYVQYMTGALGGLARRHGRSSVRFALWNADAARVINARTYTAADYMTEVHAPTAGETMTINALTKGNETSTTQRLRNQSHASYMAQPWERQAHRLAAVISKVLGAGTEEGRQGARKTIKTVISNKCKRSDSNGVARVAGRRTVYW